MPLARKLPLPGEDCPAFLIESLQPHPGRPYSRLQNSAQNPDNYPELEGLKARVAGGCTCLNCTLQYGRGNVRLGGLRLTRGGKQAQDSSL